MTNQLASALGCTAFVLAGAAAAAQELDWTYVGVSVGSTVVEDDIGNEGDGEGVRVDGRYALTDEGGSIPYLWGDWVESELDAEGLTLRTSTLTGGIGYGFELTDNSHLFVEGGYGTARTEFAGISLDYDDYVASVGARTLLSTKLELNGSLGTFGGDSTVIGLGGAYRLSDSLSITADMSLLDEDGIESTTVTFGVRAALWR